MAYRCPEATAVGTAKLNGYELAFRRGYLTILPKEDALSLIHIFVRQFGPYLSWAQDI